MNITVYTVGRVKEKFFREAVLEYAKRLKRYCKLKIVEVADEKTSETASETEINKIKQTEGQRLLARMNQNEYVIALALDGKKYDSTGMADHLQKLMIYGHSDIGFVIGGSLGLSDEVLERANEKMSFSDLTFPHQLMRVILLEQIYRCFRIIRKEPYHK